MDYSNLSQPWQEQQIKNQRTPLRRSASYFFGHHPENWEVVVYTQSKSGDKKTKKISIPILLPVLSTIVEEAGVNGVRMQGKRPDSSLLQTRMIQSGWTILDPNRHDYMRLYPAINGGSHFSNKFTKIENLAGRIIKTFDEEMFRDWRCELMVSGAIALPHKAIIQLMLIDQNRSISKREQNQHTPEGAARLQAAYDKYSDIETASNRITKMREKAYVL